MPTLTPAQAAKIARCPVLVLSANRYTSQLVRSLFFGLGMQDVAVAEQSEAAIERFRTSRLELVVADSGPSTFDPLDSIGALRAMPDQRQAATPVILLITPEAAPRAEGLAPLSNIQYLNKPVSNQHFKDKIFRLVLNIEPRCAKGPETVREPRRLTTLLLSGNPYTAQVIRALLLTLGLSDVAVAATPADAEQQLRAAGFDLVIIDSGPTSFDALTAVEAARSACANALLAKPILLLASDPSASLVARARAAEVKAIAMKPLDSQAFAERVRKLLGLTG